jgi:hypothetical protein
MFVKESTSNPEETRELVWKRPMLSCVYGTASIKNSTPRCHCIYSLQLYKDKTLSQLCCSSSSL